MKNFRVSLLAIMFIFWVVSHWQCKQIQQLQAFSKCEFRLQSVQILSLDNVDVSGKKSIQDFDAITITRLGSSLLQGRMPISFRAYIEARNPNKQKASIGQMLVHVLFNNTELLQTQVHQRIEVLPMKTTLFPLDFQSDIGNLLKGENIRNVLGLLFPGSDTPAVFTFKIKPSVVIGPATIQYPGYITLTKDFKSQ